MSPRPTDWSPLGIGSDPTPGDPDQVQDVLTLLKTMSDDFQTIYDTLNTVNGYAASGNLVGKTADELRKQMNGRITKFVESAHTAFSQAVPAITTYHTAITTHQQTADDLLNRAHGSGLGKDDPQIKSWAQQAQQAGSDLQDAENTAAHAIRSLPGPSDPLSPWEEFLKILGWIALLLILPAMIFGGPIALIELVVNAVLFVDALVQFAEGNLSFGGLLLAALGVIAPTTRALDLGEIVNLMKGIGSAAKSGLITVKSGLNDFIDLLTSTKLTDLFNPDTLSVLGNFVLKAGVWVFTGLKNLPSVLLKTGPLVASKFGELFLTGVDHITTSLKTGSWLSAFLPVSATEIAKLGLGDAFRLGFLERGLLISSDPARDLAALNKLSFAGIHTGAINPEGFGHLNPPNLTTASWKIPDTANTHMPTFANDFKALNIDTHLEAPTLSMGNLAAAFQHGSMDVGTISIHVPDTTIHIGHLEVPDLRNPPELNRIGQGTVITHFSDVSMVTVHEDLVPQTPHMDIGGLTVPGLHTGDVTVPTLHTGSLPNTNVHVANIGSTGTHQLSTPVTTTGATHLSQNFHVPTQVPGLHAGAISVPSLHTPDVSALGSHALNAPNLPNLGNIAHTRISTADTTATTLSHTDTSLTLTTGAHLGTTDLTTVNVAQPDALSHLAPPTVASPHIATPHIAAPGTTTVGHLAAPTVATPHLATESGATIATGHLAAPTIATPHAADTGASMVAPHLTAEPGTTAAATPHLTESGAANLGGTHLATGAVPTNLPNLHVAVPDSTALGHLAEGAPTLAVHPVAPLHTPQLNPVRLSDAAHGQTGGAAEIKTLQNIPEAKVRFTDAGVHGKVADIEGASPETDLGTLSQDPNAALAVSAHASPQGAPVVGHGESATVPAVSSSSVDDGLAHSAGAGGDHVASPDLAGKPGLIDSGAERLAVPWNAFRQAQHDYHTALSAHQLAFPKPDKDGVGPSDIKGKGKQTDAQSLAEQQLHTASESLDNAAAALHQLGTDPAHLTALDHAALTKSLVERPRLVGGSRPGDAVLRTDPHTDIPTLTSRPAGGNLRLFIDHGGENEHAVLTDVHTGQHLDTGRLVESDAHGGFRLQNPDNPAVFREYLPDGTLHVTGLAAVDHLGQPVGRLEILHGTGTADFHPAGGTALNGLRHQAVDGGGHLVLDDASENRWTFDGGGVLTHQGMAIEHGGPIGATHLEIDFAGESAQTFAHGNPHGTWDYTEHAGGFSLHGTRGRAFHFDDEGALVAHDLTLSNPDGLAAGTVIRTDTSGPAAPAFSVHDANGRVPHLTVTRGGDGRFTVTDTRSGSVGVFDHAGQLEEQTFGAVDHTGTALGDVHIDYGTGNAHFSPPGATVRVWRYTSADDGFRLTQAGGRRLDFDHGGTLLGEHLPLRDHGADTATYVRADYRDPANIVLSLHDAADRPLPHQVELDDEFEHFTVTDAAGVNWRGYDRGGDMTGRNLRVFDHTGAHLDTIEIDYAAGHADVGAFGYGRQRWQYTGQGTGFTLTHLGNELTFDNADHLSSLSFRTQGGLLHATPDAHIHADFAGAHGPVFEVRDGAGAQIAHYRVTRDGAGHFTVTDTRAGQTHGSFTQFEQFTGVVRDERVNLLDHGGIHVRIDHLNPPPGNRLAPHDAHGAVTRFDAVRDPATGRITLTDTRGAHNGDTKVFDEHGAPVSEHITITDKRGNATGQSFHVDFATMRWTRQSGGVRVRAFGHDMNNARAIGLAHGYNTAGAAVLKRDGSLVLTGEDKTPAFLREPLSDGSTLELLRGPDGRRVWTTWDHTGFTGAHGVRHFSTEADGVTSWDIGGWGQTVREYRTAIDGGTVRAERLPAGGYRWSRFTKEGELTLSGTRAHRPWGWTDKIPTGDVVQRQWNAFNFLAHASHYREYGVGRDGAGVFRVKGSYKEISQQAKDTGSKEILANGHTLTFTRYAEQRPPDFLWKTPENLDSVFSKGLAHLAGSKYGAIDFPHDGFFHADSRFQVFKWKERDPATGAVVSHGVRVYTPDGSFTDFAGDGVLVRATLKLDNGHSVEIGRDGAGKWDSVRLGPGGARPGAGTLAWRQLDGNKNLVAQGTRNFEGKHWIDTFTAGDGSVRVARNTSGEGDVVHYLGDDKPTYDPARPVGNRVVTVGNESSITRNTMGQIVERTEGWGRVGTGANTVRVTGHGDPRTGDWHWQDSSGATGLRVSVRNTHGSGAWDDSFHDFQLNAAGQHELVHDFHALDKGTSLRAKPNATGGWRSVKFDAEGRPQLATAADRQWRQADGTFGNVRPVGRKDVPWRDVDAGGNVVRELVDGRVREFTGVGGHTWKEYDFGSVWRERADVTGRPGLYVEKESFQKQWRITNAQGTLLRYRSAAGRVYERNSFGTWKLVGTEREDKGLLTEFRGMNRRVREPNRYQFRIEDGAAGAFRGTGAKLGQKTILDFIQEFTIDVGANIIITGATQGWNFNGDDWGRILLGGAIRAGVKGGYGVLSETVLKDLRDGLRNIDGGKDFNRRPYNNDKFWDNEWAGNENPQRWRSGVFDYGVGNVLVPSIGSATATLFTSLAFGVGENGTHLDFGQLMEATGLSFAGGLVSNLTAGAAKFGLHQLSSGRLFHNGGLPDIALNFGEKMLLDFLVNDLLLPHIHTTASSVLPPDDKNGSNG